MSYQAQGGWLDVIMGPIGGAAAGATVDKFRGPQYYLGKTIDLEVSRNAIAAAWPAGKTDYTVEQAVAITRAVTDALSELNKQISKLVGRDLSLAGMHGLATYEARAYAGEVGTCIAQAKQAGSAIARCPRLRSSTLAALSNIVGHYETLAKKEHELDSSILQRTEEAFAYVGKWVKSVVDNLPVPRVPDFGGIAELLKWLTLAGVGGGLIYFIWKQEKRR